MVQWFPCPQCREAYEALHHSQYRLHDLLQVRPTFPAIFCKPYNKLQWWSLEFVLFYELLWHLGWVSPSGLGGYLLYKCTGKCLLQLLNETHSWSQQGHSVSCMTTLFFYACKSPDKTSGHMYSELSDWWYRWSLNLPQGFVWVYTG